MVYEPDPWAKEWLEERRRADPAGTKGWTVERRGNSHYLKWGTTYRDSTTGKCHKRSQHLGVLNRDGTVTPTKPRNYERGGIVRPTVRNHGTSVLLKETTKDIIDPLKFAFPDMWAEILALAGIRLYQIPGLSHVSDIWHLLDDPSSASPHMTPEVLLAILDSIGQSPRAMERFFSRIDNARRHLVCEYSIVFPKRSVAFLQESGFGPQMHPGDVTRLIFECDADTGAPVRARMMPASDGDDCLDEVLAGLGPDDIFYIKGSAVDGDTVRRILDTDTRWVMSITRQMDTYDDVVADQGPFVWKGTPVYYGTGRSGDTRVYRYVDNETRQSEMYEAIRNMDVTDALPMLDKAGNFVMTSNMDLDPGFMYSLQDYRGITTRIYRDTLSALTKDSHLLSSENQIRGYLFVTFVTYCIEHEIRSRLVSSGLIGSYGYSDIVWKFAAAKVVYLPDGAVLSEIPDELREIAERIGIDLDQPPE